MYSNQSGQALLEITIASGLALLVVTAITITTIVGLRNSQFAQNQLQATKYAQEGMGLVQTIQARNCPIVVGGVNYYWYNDSTSLTPPPLIWGNQSSLQGNYLPQVSNTVCQLLNSNTPEPIQTKFSRQVILAPSSSNQKVQITSSVSWTDFSGTHQSQLVTILSSE